jgi:AcrR family transcriptional regulator
MEAPRQLPVLQPEPAPAERADAARNRERILCAARRLFAERGPDCVSMDEIARGAGVGKGTLFRRFGSRAALASAILSEDERRLQEAMIRGAPPLGPGAPPAERLIAFGGARLDLLAQHGELIAAAEVGSWHFDAAPAQVARLHISLLLREADPACDSEYLTEVLMAALEGARYVYLRHARGIDLDRLKRGWSELVTRLLAPKGGVVYPLPAPATAAS